jgi:hypothetical protein
MMLRAPAVVPPMVLFAAPPEIVTPLPALPTPLPRLPLLKMVCTSEPLRGRL